MHDDLEIIKQLENEIGLEIKSWSMSLKTERFGKETSRACVFNDKGDAVELFLNSTQIKSFPTKVLELKELRVLHFFRSKLESIPPEINKLIHLEHLYIRGGSITSIPRECSQFCLRFLAHVGGAALVDADKDI